MTTRSVSSQMRDSIHEWGVMESWVIDRSSQLIKALIKKDGRDIVLNYQDYLYGYRDLKLSLKNKALEWLSGSLSVQEEISFRLANLKALNGIVKRVLAQLHPHTFSALLTQNVVSQISIKCDQYKSHYDPSEQEPRVYLRRYNDFKNNLKEALFYFPDQPELKNILIQLQELHRRVPHPLIPCKIRAQMCSLFFLFMHLHFVNRNEGSIRMCHDIFKAYNRLRALVKAKDTAIDQESLILKNETFLLDRYARKMEACLSVPLQEEPPQQRGFQKRARALRRETYRFIRNLMNQLEHLEPVVEKLESLKSSLKEITRLPNQEAIEKFQKNLVISILEQLEKVSIEELKLVFEKLFSHVNLHKEFNLIVSGHTNLQPFTKIPLFFQYLPFLAMIQTSPRDDSRVLETSLLAEFAVDRASSKALEILDPVQRLCASLKVAQKRIEKNDLSYAICEISDICSEFENKPWLKKDSELKKLLIATVDSLGNKILNASDIITLTLGASYCAIPNLIISEDPLCYLKDSMLVKLACALMNAGYCYESLRVFAQILHPANQYETYQRLYQNALSQNDKELMGWILRDSLAVSKQQF